MRLFFFSHEREKKEKLGPQITRAWKKKGGEGRQKTTTTVFGDGEVGGGGKREKKKKKKPGLGVAFDSRPSNNRKGEPGGLLEDLIFFPL